MLVQLVNCDGTITSLPSGSESCFSCRKHDTPYVLGPTILGRGTLLNLREAIISRKQAEITVGGNSVTLRAVRIKDASRIERAGVGVVMLDAEGEYELQHGDVITMVRGHMFCCVTLVIAA